MVFQLSYKAWSSKRQDIEELILQKRGHTTNRLTKDTQDSLPNQWFPKRLAFQVVQRLHKMSHFKFKPFSNHFIFTSTNIQQEYWVNNLWWWTFSLHRYHLPNTQCFSNERFYRIYSLLKFQFLDTRMIIKLRSISLIHRLPLVVYTYPV